MRDKLSFSLAPMCKIRHLRRSTAPPLLPPLPLARALPRSRLRHPPHGRRQAGRPVEFPWKAQGREVRQGQRANTPISYLHNPGPQLFDSWRRPLRIYYARSIVVTISRCTLSLDITPPFILHQSSALKDRTQRVKDQLRFSLFQAKASHGEGTR